MEDLTHRLAALEHELARLRAQAVPVGAVQAFARPAPPDGWLACDGAELSRQQYPRLFEALGTAFGAGDGETTFRLPDLRGQFVRGWDDEGNVDPERAFGTSQEDAFQGHRHAAVGHSHGATCDKDGDHKHNFHGHRKENYSVIKDSMTGKSGTVYEVYPDDKKTEEAGRHRHDISIATASETVGGPLRSDCGEPRADTETRPRNVALLYCIKW